MPEASSRKPTIWRRFTLTPRSAMASTPQGGHHGHGQFGNRLMDGVRILERIDVGVETDVILSEAENFKDFLHTHKSYSFSRKHRKKSRFIKRLNV